MGKGATIGVFFLVYLMAFAAIAFLFPESPEAGLIGGFVIAIIAAGIAATR